MPNRILKESICTSESIAALSPQAELLFYHLMVKCDDFGVFDGRLQIIRCSCFPLHAAEISDHQLRSWLVELERQHMMEVYENSNHAYLRLIQWQKYQQIRSKKPKYPLPDAPGSQKISFASTYRQAQSNKKPLKSDDVVTNQGQNGTDALTVPDEGNINKQTNTPCKQRKSLDIKREQLLPYSDSYSISYSLQQPHMNTRNDMTKNREQSVIATKQANLSTAASGDSSVSTLNIALSQVTHRYEMALQTPVPPIVVKFIRERLTSGMNAEVLYAAVNEVAKQPDVHSQAKYFVAVVNHWDRQKITDLQALESYHKKVADIQDQKKAKGSGNSPPHQPSYDIAEFVRLSMKRMMDKTTEKSN